MYWSACGVLFFPAGATKESVSRNKYSVVRREEKTECKVLGHCEVWERGAVS